MKTKSIMIVGVGGQGTLLASRVLGHLFMDAGYDVKVSEVHGMSQRGGSVVTYVRFGDTVASPIIDEGQADYIISFELLEAARYLPYLRDGGKLISNSQQMDPMPVITGATVYPDHIPSRIVELGVDADIFDALTLARAAGSAKAVNIVLLGRFSRYFDFSPEAWDAALRDVIPARFLAMNLKAFESGRTSA